MSVQDLTLPLPQPERTSRLGHKLVGALALGAFAYPAILISSLYATWFAAWSALGHAPRPSLDDPKYIGLLVDVPYAVTMAALMGGPAAIVLGLFLVPVMAARRSTGLPRRVLYGLGAVGALALMWVAALWFLRADPWEVVNWYMD